MKTFREFEKLNEDMRDPPETDPDFTDKQEDALHCMEINFFPMIGHKYTPAFWEEFWKDVTEQFEIWFKFDTSLSDKSEELWNKTYIVKGFDTQTDLAIHSPKYKEIEKRVHLQYPRISVPDHLRADTNDKEIITARRAIFLKNINNEKAFKKALEKELYLNLFKTYVKEFWEIYKEAIDSLESIRGRIAGKKYGF